MTLTHSSDVIVVGAGLAGLSCAVALGDAGLHVRVLEAAGFAGGRARSWIHVPTGDAVDIGPHVVHSGYANFMRLLGRLGTADRIEWQPRKLITIANANRDGAAALCHRRGLTPPLSLLPDLARASRLSRRDLVSNNRVTWRALRFHERDVPAWDRMTGLDLLRECGTSRAMIDWFWRFASIVVLNVPLERVSAASLLRVHSQLIGQRGLHFGFPRVGLSELYVPQSIDAVHATGGEVRLRTPVTALDRTDGRVVVHTGTHASFAARHVVLAIPPRELRALEGSLAPGEALLEPSPYRCVYLWFDRSLGKEKFWALRWSPERLNYDFYDLSNIRPSLADRASVIASNVVYSHRAASLTPDELVRATIEEIAVFAPHVAAARLLHADVHDVPMAVPVPVTGFERARPRTRTKIDGVMLAGDWTRTHLPCSMESAVRSGMLAAEAVLDSRGIRARLARPPPRNDGLAGVVQRLTARRTG